jgi:uncharacterized repeat protein (TIGR01451 family)
MTQFSGLSPTDFNTWVNIPANSALLSPPPTLTLNGSWDGTSSSNILSATQTLTSGQTQVVYVSFDVTVDPGAVSPNNFLRDNSATAQASLSSSIIVSDTSTNGIDPDGDGDNGDGTTDGDGVPDEDDSTPASYVKLIKEVRNCGSSLSSCIGPYVTSEEGEPGDYLEYRIRYSNISSQSITTLDISDTLVPETPFQEDTYSLLSPSGIADFSIVCPDTTVVDIDRSDVAVVTTPPSGAISAFDIDVMASSVCSLTTVDPAEHGTLLFKVKIP